jgi:hypothetical protein
MQEKNTLSVDKRLCSKCGSDVTLTRKTGRHKGTEMWYRDGNGGSLCNNCYSVIQYHKIHPNALSREEWSTQMRERICIDCGGDSTYQKRNYKGRTYDVWNSAKLYGRAGWLCGKCLERTKRQLGLVKKDPPHSMLSPERLQKLLDRNRNFLREYRKRKGDKLREQQRQYHFRLKVRLMQILDQAACVYCGSELFQCLQFDHKNGGGTKELIGLFGGNTLTMKRYYIQHPEEAREKLNVVCANCNILKKWRYAETSPIIVQSDIL